jgi:hypothetical protein
LSAGLRLFTSNARTPAGGIAVAAAVAATLAAHRAATAHERIALGYGVTVDALDRLLAQGTSLDEAAA